MQEHQEAMVKSLVAVAWADGRVHDEETEVIEALISAFELSEADAKGIREYAKTKRVISDVPLSELSAHDRRLLLQHAMILTYVDGHQSDEEKQVLEDLVKHLRVPAEEAKEILVSAEQRAKKLLDLL